MCYLYYYHYYPRGYYSFKRIVQNPFWHLITYHFKDNHNKLYHSVKPSIKLKPMVVKSSFVLILVSIHKPVQISMNAMRSCKGSHYLAPEHIVADLLTSLSRDRVTGESQPRLGASLSRDTDTPLTSPPLA